MKHKLYLMIIISFTVTSSLFSQIISAGSGVWTDTGTWVGGVVPTATDDVVIASGHTVTLNVLNAVCKNISVIGTLQFAIDGTTTGITVNGDVNVNGSFKCVTRNPVGAENSFVNHTMSLYGDLTVNGVIDFRGGSNGDGTANGCELTFLGSSNSSISLSRTTYGSSAEEFNAININKTGGAKVILTSGNLFMSNNSSVGSAYLTFTNGMIETGSNIWATMVTSSSGVSGADETKYVNGNFGRGMSTSSGTGRVFEIGTSTGYRPIKVYSTTGLLSKSFIVASMVEGDADSSSTLTGGIDKVSELRYYNLKAYVGASMLAATVSVNELRPSYLDNDGVSSGNTDLRVAYSTDGRANWIGIAQTSTHTTNPSSSPTTIQPDTLSSALTLDGTTTAIYVALANATGGVNVLPVELTSLSANTTNEGVLINWRTATEVNNYGFEIESSNNNSTWLTIGFIEGHGNSNSPNEYSFLATDGALRYRLKQIDTDGSFEYSDVIEVVNNLNYKLLQNHPNPFNPTTIISYTLPKATNVNLSIYNTLGQKVAEVVNETMDAGSHQVNFDASQLTSGMYFYKIEAGDFSKTMKMMLLK